MDDMDDESAAFLETEDSIDESLERIVADTWLVLSADERRLRKGMLKKALKLWIEEGYVVVPDDYMDDRDA